MPLRPNLRQTRTDNRGRMAWLYRVALLACASLSLTQLCCSSKTTTDSECAQIERARCTKLATPACGATVTDAQSCINFYETQCSRGLSTSATHPTSTVLTQCIDAIEASCATAQAPEASPACAFLIANDADAAVVDDAQADVASDASDASDTQNDSDAANAGDS